MKEQSVGGRVMLGLEVGVWLGYTSLIFFLSSHPAPPALFLFTHVDKLYHTAAFMVLGAIGCQIGFRFTHSLFWSVWLGGLTASLFGISDEWHQFFVPGRSSSMGDIIADFCGAWFGALLWGTWIGHYYRKVFK